MLHDPDRNYYNVTPHHFEPAAHEHIKAYIATVAKFLDAVAPRLREHCAGQDGIDVLELGAGTCLATLMIRKILPSARLTCLDISLLRMRALIADSAKFLETYHDGIELIEADFSNELPIADARFDLVVFDASLHHSRNIWSTLRECRRVVRPNGAVAALREQYLAPLTCRFALERLLRSHEVAAGVSESAYLKEQYAYYFLASGFEPTFYPVYPNMKWRLLSPLNGIIYSKWSVWAQRISEGL
jgi:ubiquinone/menaquinone biosynthesis C-methylase UbiE